jgi:hypothetical protein
VNICITSYIYFVVADRLDLRPLACPFVDCPSFPSLDFPLALTDPELRLVVQLLHQLDSASSFASSPSLDSKTFKVKVLSRKDIYIFTI